MALVDDHDMYQSNLWGWSGKAVPTGADFRFGGYVMTPSWVNAVQASQCGHNPDPFDPTPVLQGISVYYTAFSYGGVSFALLEDRKFKNTNQFGTDPQGNPLPLPRDLLGARQESFLATWAGLHPGQPKVCFSQTTFATAQTTVNGLPAADADSDANPVSGRRAALQLIKNAKAVMISGDRHLGSLIRHGLDTFTDGPVQFTVPAAGSGWQRWFEPAAPLPHANGPNTGDFTDNSGNRLRMLAVANPRITLAAVRAVQPLNNIGDRALKREGYGILDIDKAAAAYRFHCWPWNTDPTLAGATEYPGWPTTIPFTQA